MCPVAGSQLFFLTIQTILLLPVSSALLLPITGMVMQVSLKKEEREKPASSRKCTKCKGKAPQTLRGKNLKLDKKEKFL